MTQDTGSTNPARNPDAPLATVTLGASEIASYLVALAGLLNGYLGRDYGLGQNAQMISVLIAGLVILGTTLARAIKHHAAMHANAIAYAARATQAINTAIVSTPDSAAPAPAPPSAPAASAPPVPNVPDPSGI